LDGARRNPLQVSYPAQNAQTAKPADDTVPWLKKPTKRLNGRMILAISRKTI
jgi:hypothetical protein